MMTATCKRFSLGCDHAGYEYKELIKRHLLASGHQVEDFGTFSPEACDYPDFIRPAAEAVARGKCDAGVVLGGSGNGEAIVSNKVAGVRCAVCWSEETARLAKTHNNANIISVGQRMVTPEMAIKMVDAWLGAEFEGGRHRKRIDKIREIG